MKRLLKVCLIIAIAGALFVWKFGKTIYSENTAFQTEYKTVFISTGTEYQELMNMLIQDSIVADSISFHWVAKKKKYTDRVKAGKYVFYRGMSNNSMVNKLRSGDQAPVQITFNSIRTTAELAGRLTRNVEADSLTMLKLLTDETLASQYGFTITTFTTMFIPNTYEIWWNSSPEQIVQRMAKEYKAFWSEDRLEKAWRLGLSQSEITALASIVKAETSKWDEAPKIAGVYVNRLKKNMALQADPTLIFALGDFTITRVLDKHKKIDSPYNTYMYTGLPPGPINIPEPVYLDGVLNAEKHDYIFFCAKPDFSGYHNFSKTYRQHQAYAREYQRELNRRRIYH